MVCRRPPHLHLLHKHRESSLNGHVDPNAFAHDRFFCCPCHLFSLLFSLAIRSESPPHVETHPAPSPTPDRSAPANERHPPDPTDTSVSSRPCYRSPDQHPSARAD